MTNILCVSGYGWSGSGLLIDMLKKEKSMFCHLPVELRFIKDDNGLIDLYNSVLSSSSVFNFDIKLRNFEHLCLVLSRKNGFRFGMNYNYIFSNLFIQSLNKFLYKLKCRTYNSDAFTFQYDNNVFQDLYWKVLRKFNLASRLSIRYSPPDLIEFQNYCIDFINDLCSIYEGYVILDQALEPNDLKTFYWLFPNQKFITVDRDPRDVYVDYLKSKDVSFDVNEFIRLFLIKRKGIENNCVQLNLKFEDLILDKKQSLIKLKEYLNLSEMTFNNLLNYDFGNSINNIGIHKNHEDQKAITTIEEHLKDYCHFV
jgi:hypothetical protein